MLTPVLIVIGVLLTLAIFILFDDPKPHNWRELGRYSPLFKSSLKSDNYQSQEEVFKTLKDAGIGPCFLGSDLSDGDV
jgi:phage major head subunit gpT-like protein